MSPSCSASAARTARAMASGRSRGLGMSRAAWRTSTGNMRPALSITSASSRPARRAPSAVADMAISRSSGRSTRWQVTAQRECQVGFQRTLMHLVEDHRGDALQPLIGKQATDQQALGDDLDTGCRRDGGVQPVR